MSGYSHIGDVAPTLTRQFRQLISVLCPAIKAQLELVTAEERMPLSLALKLLNESEAIDTESLPIDELQACSANLRRVLVTVHRFSIKHSKLWDLASHSVEWLEGIIKGVTTTEGIWSTLTCSIDQSMELQICMERLSAVTPDFGVVGAFWGRADKQGPLLPTPLAVSAPGDSPVGFM